LLHADRRYNISMQLSTVNAPKMEMIKKCKERERDREREREELATLSTMLCQCSIFSVDIRVKTPVCIHRLTHHSYVICWAVCPLIKSSKLWHLETLKS